MARTVEQQIAEAQNKLNRLKTKQRTKDTRRKIVTGATVLAEIKQDREFAAVVLGVLRRRVTRDVDLRDMAPVFDELELILRGPDNEQ